LLSLLLFFSGCDSLPTIVSALVPMALSAVAVFRKAAPEDSRRGTFETLELPGNRAFHSKRFAATSAVIDGIYDAEPFERTRSKKCGLRTLTDLKRSIL
jgi:hypothetical protein